MCVDACALYWLSAKTPNTPSGTLMDFCNEIGELLRQRNFKSIGNKFYLPNSSTRPERNTPALTVPTGNFAALPAPFDSLCKKYLESLRLLNSLKELNVSSLQLILNSCKEFFK